MKMIEKLRNNNGFTLMEVVIAMALVTLIASYVATAMSSTQRSVVASQTLSSGGDQALTDCENFLASDTNAGDSNGNYVLKKTGGQLAGFPDVALAIENGVGVDNDVKYVAFKRADGNENSALGGGPTGEGGGGAASGNTDSNTEDGNNGGGNGNGNSKDEDKAEKESEKESKKDEHEAEKESQKEEHEAEKESKKEEITTPPQTVTEPPMQPTTSELTTEAQSEETTSSVPKIDGNDDMFFGGREDVLGINKGNAYYNWKGEFEYIPCYDKTFNVKDDIYATIGWSCIKDIDQNGILLGKNHHVRFYNIVDTANYGWNICNTVTVHIATKDGSVPTFLINGQIVTGDTFVVSGGGFQIQALEQEIYVTGFSVTKP